METTAGVLVGVVDEESVDVKSYYDAFGNVHRTEFITGGNLVTPPAGEGEDWGDGVLKRENGTVHSYTQTRFDSLNRPVAEMQQTDGSVVAVWSIPDNSFVINGTSTIVPTKLYEYNDAGSLAAVELPAVADPNDHDQLKRPRYDYAYDESGNQTLIVDPLGNETRFTYTDHGRQATRTLPLGFGSCYRPF